MAYDPETTLRELRAAVEQDRPTMREMAPICANAAANAAHELWADPRAREAAGLGAVVAAATFASFAESGRDAALMNAVGLFGLALVDSARADLGGAS